MHTEKSVFVGRAFRPRASDVFVVTYPKCGTTWMTQIVHALRSSGNMDFGEITEIAPWDILAHDCGQDLDAEQVAEPRLFKSHESWASVPKGARYIYVVRNPLDAFVSFHKFLPAYTGLQPGDITQQQFANAIFAGASHSGQIWSHFLGWWKQRQNPNVLWVCFEDMKSDLRGSIRRIAAFLKIKCSEELLDIVASRSSYKFMSLPAQKHHFDDHFVQRHVRPKMGLALTTSSVSKVRAGGGKVGGRSAIPRKVLKRLETKWTQILRKPTGCTSYAELRQKVNEQKV